jgi:hypothetical protein
MMPSCSVRFLFAGVALVVAGGSGTMAQFDGQPPLGPQDVRRRLFAPYDMVELNCLGMNYCENLVDMRVNLTSYTHLDSDINSRDAWHLQFPDDTARFVEGLAWEARYAPVARIETARRLLKGLMAAHVPGTRGEHFFRHRSAGKTYLILDDSQSEKQGRLTLSTWGDTVEGAVQVGFRARFGEKWHSVQEFEYEDTPRGAATTLVGRNGTANRTDHQGLSSATWNLSPYRFRRHYRHAAGSVDFRGAYWYSDEDKPLEYTFESEDAEELEIVVGQPNKHMRLLWDFNPDNIAPGVIQLPDRTTEFRSDKQGDVTFEPAANSYFVLRKETVWCSRGYSSALLVMWEGTPTAITAHAQKGYGHIGIRFARSNAKVAGRVWLFPIPWLNQDEIRYIHRNAESYLTTGRLLQNGFPSQQLVNAIPAGLAAGAWMLARYHDPAAPVVSTQAESAVDAMVFPESEGRFFLRAFMEVKAAAWMVLLGRELGDERLVQKYLPWVATTATRMMSPALGYDGSAWSDGWTHFNSIKALWLAWLATEEQQYREAWQRAMAVYTIDSQAIYRRGKALEAPGGFGTYSGTLPLAVWGHAGNLKDVDQLIQLEAPNGWHPDPSLPLRKVWHDGGAGPWAQDDSQPDFVGYCLRGLELPRQKQFLPPIGAGVMYDTQGHVRITGQRILDNPFFLESKNSVRIVEEDEISTGYDFQTFDLRPGSELEQKHADPLAGELVEDYRAIRPGAKPIVYSVPIDRDIVGASLHASLAGDAYQIDVSPDGVRWFQRLDSWSRGFEKRALDVSFLVGNRDQLVEIQCIDPGKDAAVLVSNDGSRIQREQCRTVTGSGAFVYRLELPLVTLAQAEMILGNGYRVEMSSNGRQWSDAIRADMYAVRQQKRTPDAAWLRMVDLTPVLGENQGTVFLRFSDLGQPEDYGGHFAFLRRLTVYGVLDSKQLHIRISNVAPAGSSPVKIEQLTLRTWSPK